MSYEKKILRIPSLDGLRAISIAMVIFGHLVGTRGFPITRLHYDFGNLGVRVFFVISGFLITHLLLKEQAKIGVISLAGFYKRRALRIFPAFYAYLFVVVALTHFGVIDVSRGDALAAASYTMNYHPVRAWQVGHLWSLSVEEQFYLLWPATLAFLGCRRAAWVAGAWLFIAPLVRAWAYHTHSATIDESFGTVADALAIGCLFAIVRPVWTKLPVLGWEAFFCLVIALEANGFPSLLRDAHR